MKYREYIQHIKRQGKEGARVTLFQRLYFEGKQWQTALRISVPENCYDKKNYTIIKGEEKERYNHIIETSRQILRDLMLRYELIEKRVPTLDEIALEYEAGMQKEGLKGKKKKEEISSVLYVRMDEFIDEQARLKNWSKEMRKKFVTLKNLLKEYTIELTFENTDDTALLRFQDYLQDEKDYLNSTLQKQASYLRWYLRWASNKGYYKGKSHDTFRPKYKGGNFEQKKVIFLTEEELHKLETHIFDKPDSYLERVRDVFLFACYSGLRYSDVYALCPWQIHDDLIEVVTKKTSDRITINLNKHTRAILAKYKTFADKTGRCLPVATNQDTNRFLHTLGKVCKLDTPTTQIYFKGEERTEVVLPKYEYLTFHVARKTFITQALRLGIPAPVIMKFSGHHSMAMLKPYMQVVDELKKKEMAKFDEM